MPQTQPKAQPRRAMAFVQALTLAVLWILFSGKLDVVHLSYGVVSILLVMILSRRLLLAPTVAEENELARRIRWGRVAIYPFWLLWQIVASNLQMAAIILRPKLDLDPILLRFDFPVDDPLAKVTLGNSITLTPGTYTLRIRGREFLVHSISRSLAAGLIDGSMQRVVGLAFGQDLPAPEMHFATKFRPDDREAD